MVRKVFISLILGSFVAATASLSGCGTENKKAGIGAGAGAAAGGLLGAVIGHQSGNRGAGALIGAAVGAGLGGLVGHRLDQQQKELNKIAETKKTDQGLVTKLKSDILFDTGKADLKPQATQNITQMAEIMKKYPENVLLIKGYTDSTGSVQINEALSKRRADAVREVLVSNGIPASTVSTEGMGPLQPVGDNKTSAGRSQNRRVEVEISVDESKVPKKG